MNNNEAIIDFGSKNLRLGVFDQALKNIYYSEQKIIDSDEYSLNTLIRNAEKSLNTHIDNIVVMYDSPKFYSLDLSFKKVFDQVTSIQKVYANLLDEAHFFVSQNNFKDQIIHLVVNNIFVDENKNIEKIVDDIKIKSIILEIKFICLNKTSVDNLTNKFKKNNLKITNLYCSSYIKTIFYKKKFNYKDDIIFIDIGYERTSSLIFSNFKFEYFKSIPLGSNNITKDISKVLNLDLDYSENLKIKFNEKENDIFLNKSNKNELNPYIEILGKNISMDLLKKIIEARVDEIIELVVFQSNFLKKLNNLAKPKLFAIGKGSALLSNNYDIAIKKSVSKLSSFDEMDSQVCLAGLEYHQSDESSFNKEKKKVKKRGFFENFFNLFSK